MISSNSLIDGFSRILSQYPFNKTSTDDTSPSVNIIPKHVSAIPYEDFFDKCLAPNTPCMFGSWLTDNWKSKLVWVDEGHPNLFTLMKKFGSASVPVADCSKSEYGSQPKQTWTMKQFAEYWMQRSEMDVSKCTTQYLKDWHFVREFPEYVAYTTPMYFKSDWLNEACDEKCFHCDEDFRFVYMGPKGSWTPFHADVYRSYSWSANICGKKKWFFCPPGKEDKLRDKFGNLPYDVRDLDKHKRQCFIEVIQEAGEVIFVPSGWHHQVHNMEDTISINHNWINGCNVMQVWKFLQEELAAVEKEIDDCRESMTSTEWRDQCQMLMKVNTGMDFAEFLKFLRTIVEPRLKKLQQEFKTDLSTEIDELPNDVNSCVEVSQATLVRLKRTIQTHKHKFDELGKEMNHTVFDLCSILPVLLSLLDSLTVNKDIVHKLYFDIIHTLQNICEHYENNG